MQKFRSRRLTQKEIASKFGVSVATVSLALSGSSLVAADTREKIQQAARDYGYIRNRAAVSLRTGSARLIGVSFHDIVHPFFAEMLAAIEDGLSDSGETIFINSHNDNLDKQARFVSSLREHGADGLIISPALGTRDEDLQEFVNSGAPIVMVVRHVVGSNFDHVVNDDFECMKIATQHLLDLGHRDIVMLGGLPGTSTADGRFAGFAAALRATLGVENPLEAWIPGPAKRLDGIRMAQEALARSDRIPTGFVCLNDLVAFGAMTALGRMGLKPGHDVAVVGIDDSEESAAAFPALTTVSNKSKNLASEAVRLLRRRQAIPDAPPQHSCFPPQLIVRQSCGAAY